MEHSARIIFITNCVMLMKVKNEDDYESHAKSVSVN
jgi:hypothetical protein